MKSDSYLESDKLIIQIRYIKSSTSHQPGMISTSANDDDNNYDNDRRNDDNCNDNSNYDSK